MAVPGLEDLIGVKPGGVGTVEVEVVVAVVRLVASTVWVMVSGTVEVSDTTTVVVAVSVCWTAVVVLETVVVVVTVEVTGFGVTVLTGQTVRRTVTGQSNDLVIVVVLTVAGLVLAYEVAHKTPLPSLPGYPLTEVTRARSRPDQSCSFIFKELEKDKSQS